MTQKKLRLVSLLGLLIPVLFPLLGINAAENISPMESIEWIVGGEESLEEDSEETTEESEAAEESEEVESEESVDSEEVDTDDASSFVADLRQADQRMVEYVNFATVGEEFQLSSINMLRDEDKFYTASMTPPFLPQAMFFRTAEDETVDVAYISIDDLIKYAADSLNTQPQIYEGTFVEDFYIFTQENFADMEGKVVLVEDLQDEILEESLLLAQIESFVTDVAIEWLEDEDIQNAMVETDLGNQYNITDDNAILFNEIADRYEADYPDLSDFFALYEAGYEGTMTVDYTNGQFGIALLYDSSEELLSGLELYLRKSDAGIIDFSDDIVYGYDEFVDFVGFDLISEIKALESSLSADMFVNEFD